jgi:uncharacterized lipoprotein YbaY
MRRRIRWVAAGLGIALVWGCNRRLEPFDPNEKPSQPDLSRIFPEGERRAAQAEPMLPPAPGSEPGGPGATAEASGGPVSGTVRVADSARGSLPPGAVLFIIARRGGSGPPLAVKRIASPQFPLSFTLGPDDRMIKAMPFAGPFSLSARLDGDGNAMSRSPGDLEGSARAPVSPGEQGIEIVLGEAPEPESGASGTPGATAEASGAPVSGTVRVADSLRGSLRPGAVLFIIARRGGGGPPLAVKRIASPQFPLSFTLGPDDRMIEGTPFAGPISLSARLDGDGNAMSRSPGDLQGSARAPVSPGAQGVEIVLDQAL